MCITLLPHSHSFHMRIVEDRHLKRQRIKKKKNFEKMEFSLEAMKEQLEKLGISTEGCLVKEDCLARLLEFRAALDAKGA